ncbi:MAG: PAS domain-containing protein [Alphaproteobacteria bacterium]|nr:PAS domain-containing protein [Alphaproteobacteria bacterium]
MFRRQIRSAQLTKLFDYWAEESIGRELLARTAIDPAKICGSLPNIVILDVEGPAKFRFRFAGTAVDGQGGQFLTDRYVDEIETGGLSSQNFGGLAQVVESREPSYLSGAFKAGEGLTHHFERVAMPLSCDGRRVDAILVGIIYMSAGFAHLQELEQANYG